MWLATLPPTSGLVALMFGTRDMVTLYGIVFWAHQVGSFMGVWLGAALGLMTAFVHWLMTEKPLKRLAVETA